jgi:hypothetical protein
MPIRPADHGVISASGAGGAVVLSGGTAFTYGGADFMKFTASGTLTVAGSGLVDYIVVGAGGGGGGNANYSNGAGGGGGGGGVAWGVNYLLDSAVKSTFTITIGAGATGGSTSAAQGSNGGGSRILDFGIANDTSNFDWAGGTSYSSTADDIYSGGGGGGGRGDWAVANSGNTGNYASASDPSPGAGSDDWGSGGAGGGGGGWDGYAGGASGYGGNSWINGVNHEEIDTITAENSDSTIATHKVVGRQGSLTVGGYAGQTGQLGLNGTAASPTFPGGRAAGGDISSSYRGFVWLDGVMYSSPGCGGRGNWQDSADGGGRGDNQGGPLDALDNQGGGGAGAGGGTGGTGGSGIVIFRIVPA